MELAAECGELRNYGYQILKACNRSSATFLVHNTAIDLVVRNIGELRKCGLKLWMPTFRHHRHEKKLQTSWNHRRPGLTTLDILGYTFRDYLFFFYVSGTFLIFFLRFGNFPHSKKISFKFTVVSSLALKIYRY